jgi:hypothetical protein
LRSWIETYYPGVFAPDWLYGGKKRGWSLRYKKAKAFCTLLPEYRRLSVLIVLGGAEWEKFEERRYAWRSQLVKLYDEVKTYPDGKWLTVGISSTDDWHDVTELLTMKRPRGEAVECFGNPDFRTLLCRSPAIRKSTWSMPHTGSGLSLRKA